MTKEELINRLEKALSRLEQAEKDLIATQGYSNEVAKIRMLQEIMKEQIPNENTVHTASPVR
jgi:hypothetical protein